MITVNYIHIQVWFSEVSDFRWPNYSVRPIW